MDRDLAGKLVELLERWRDRPVAVRVVANGDVLITVFSGRLGARSNEKGPSLFWPVDLDGAARARYEKPGVYAHPQLLSEVRVHQGGFVVEFTQAGVTVNVRQLGQNALP
jgi:hypothetical protein